MENNSGQANEASTEDAIMEDASCEATVPCLETETLFATCVADNKEYPFVRLGDSGDKKGSYINVMTKHYKAIKIDDNGKELPSMRQDLKELCKTEDMIEELEKKFQSLGYRETPKFLRKVKPGTNNDGTNNLKIYMVKDEEYYEVDPQEIIKDIKSNYPMVARNGESKESNKKRKQDKQPERVSSVGTKCHSSSRNPCTTI